jgi:histidine triad (HIT) family protein
MLPQYGIELLQFQTIGMILSIFFCMIMVRTLCTFHFNENAAALSLSHINLQYLYSLNRQHAAEQEVEIYSVASITSRILYYTVKIPLAKTDPIRYHTGCIRKHPKKEKTMAEETIFSKIIRREINADIVYQDDLVTAFRDINPQAPTHVLIVPNKLIPTINDVTKEDEPALGRMITVAAKIAEEEGISENGYRLIINCNRNGGQEVYHIHMHLIGGRSLGRMLAR